MRPVRSGRLALCAAGATAVLFLTSGCLFADTTQAGRLLHDAPKKLARTPSVAITLQMASRLVRPGQLATLPQPDPGLALTGVLDPRSGRAAYMTRGAKTPTVVFDGNTMFAQLPSAKPSDARPWISTVANKKLTDYALDPAAVPGSLAAFALRPDLIVDLLSGALTGSIRRVGPATVAGVPTTEYAAKFVIDQALTDSTRVTYSQKQQDDLDKLFKILTITHDALDEGAVWLDAQGLPRRIELAIRESPAEQSRILLFLEMELAPQQTPAAVPVPAANSVETVPSLSQYLLPLKARLGGAT